MSLTFVDDLESLEPNPDQYDFVGLIKAYYEKLPDKSVLPILMNQLLKKEPEDSNEEKLTDYRMHLPVDLRRYLKTLDVKCSEISKENLQMLDGSYKTYLITFLFFCTKKNGTVTDKTKLTAACLYLKLTMLPEVGKLFFNDSMYMCFMSSLVDIIRSPDINPTKKETVIKLVKKHCLQEEHLSSGLLAASTNVIIISMISGASPEMIRSKTATGLTACSMKALRIVLLHISNHTLIKTITRRLFRCTKKRYLDLIPNRELAVDVIILFLKGTFKIGAFDRKIETFIDGFADTWDSEEFNQFKNAVKIMNAFPEEHYKELLRKMITLSSPKSTKTLLINIFNLIHIIFTMPPDFHLEKISVLYTCCVNNVLHHILNSEEEIASTAIDIFKEICDATTNPLHRYIFTEVRINHKLVNMPVESVILGLSRAANETWSPRNKQLFEIFSRFVTVTPNLNPVVVEKALQCILRDVNPRTFESSLETLQLCFLAASERREVKIAETLLRVMHRFAFCPNNRFSSMYARHIFVSLLTPSLVGGKTYSPKYYYSIYLTSRFDYELLFVKCKDLIREQEVALTIKNLNYSEPCSGILLCCLLEHYSYTNINLLVPYIINNFTDLSGHTTSGYICTALEKILKNKPVSNLNYPELTIIQDSIMNGLFQQSFPIESVRPVFSLYQVIRDILKLPEDTQQLNELLHRISEKVLRKLHNRNTDSCNSLLYLNEICLLINQIPNADFLTNMQRCLDDPFIKLEIESSMPEMHVQILTFLCTIAMLNKSKVSIPIKYLKQNLYNEDNIFKVVSIKLLYSLCKEITHEFEHVIEFSFKQMVIGNPCLVRICGSILEELIHEDYIKLTSENFFRIVYILGCNQLKVFMKSLLLNRFLLSNQNDITKFYLPTITYVNMYGKFPNYPISSTFYDELSRIKPKIDAPIEMLEFLFIKLPINKKFNILMEVSSIFEDLVRGHCKVDENFFNVLLDLISTVKLMKTSLSEKPSKHYHSNIIKIVEKQIIRFDPSHQREQYYKEFENEIRRCTLALLKLLFFENEQLASKIQMPLFDAVLHWIDFVKEELIDYVHQERGKDYDPYFAKLVQFYRKNKNMIDNFDRESRFL